MLVSRVLLCSSKSFKCFVSIRISADSSFTVVFIFSIRSIPGSIYFVLCFQQVPLHLRLMLRELSFYSLGNVDSFTAFSKDFLVSAKHILFFRWMSFYWQCSWILIDCKVQLSYIWRNYIFIQTFNLWVFYCCLLWLLFSKYSKKIIQLSSLFFLQINDIKFKTQNSPYDISRRGAHFRKIQMK